jgi:hypothetical protein
MCAFLLEGINITTKLHCTEQVLGFCAIQLASKAFNLIVLSVHNPSADLNHFLKTFDATLKYLYNPKYEFLICGDINIDHFNKNNWRKQQLKSSLKTVYFIL